jgi:hypothetical protein
LFEQNISGNGHSCENDSQNADNYFGKSFHQNISVPNKRRSAKTFICKYVLAVVVVAVVVVVVFVIFVLTVVVAVVVGVVVNVARAASVSPLFDPPLVDGHPGDEEGALEPVDGHDAHRRVEAERLEGGQDSRPANGKSQDISQ